MNKKFLSAILFGALMVSSTGTFVSCKDYDDDVKNLQEQIDKLATKEDMTSQIATLQAALTTAAKDASDAITKATAAETAAKAAGDTAAEAKAAADKAAADAKAEAIKAVQAELEALKEEITASTDAALDEMRKEVAAATKKVEDIVGKIADMVTSVELVSSFGADNNQGLEKVLSFGTASEKDNVFGKGFTGEITFTKNKQVQVPSSFVVRVSPTNAVLTPEMISLINSKGGNLNDLVEVVSVEPYDELLYGDKQPTRAAGSEAGLWKVSVKLKSYDQTAFEAATVTKVGDANTPKSIMFAAAVNNTLSTAATRQVVSSYDLQMSWVKKTHTYNLDYKVNDTELSKLRNRYDACEDGTVAGKTEYKWVDETKDNTAINSGKTNVVADLAGDDRCDNAVGAKFTNNYPNGHYLFPAVQGVPFTISVTQSASDDIRAIYVVLDSENAKESAPSELNAWNSYSYDGLNTVVEGTKTTITVNAATAINDIVGFRVYAVNWDGTLVDPDGKAFYAVLGDASTDWNATATTVMAGIDAPSAVESAKVAVKLTKLTTAAKAMWETDKCDAAVQDASPIFNIKIMKNNTVLYNSASTYDADRLKAIKFEEATSVISVPTCASWLDYKDGKTYNGTLTISNANGSVLASIKVSMTKVLPTSMPEGYSLKDKQVIGGIYNCYMLASNNDLADSWTAESAAQGRMPIENLINWGKDTSLGANYVVVFEKSADDGVENGGVKDKVLDDVKRAGNGTVNVDKKYVDNATEHATAVYYNFGNISTETKDGDGAIAPYMIAGDSFKTVYCCFYKKDVHTWNWATRAQLGGDYNTLVDSKDASKGYKANPLSTTLTYGNPIDASEQPIATAKYNAFVFGKNDIDGTFSKLLSAPYGNSLVVKNAKLVSDATQKEDYFSVSNDLEFTALKTDLGSNPKENVPSTLIVNCKDSYGHDVVITLKMTVQPRK